MPHRSSTSGFFCTSSLKDPRPRGRRRRECLLCCCCCITCSARLGRASDLPSSSLLAGSLSRVLPRWHALAGRRGSTQRRRLSGAAPAMRVAWLRRLLRALLDMVHKWWAETQRLCGARAGLAWIVLDVQTRTVMTVSVVPLLGAPCHSLFSFISQCHLVMGDPS